MKRLSAAVIVLGAVAIAATAFAYGPGQGRWQGKWGCNAQGAGPGMGHDGLGPGFGRHHARMERFLGLSEEQSGKMAEVRKKYASQMRPLFDEIVQKREELRNLYTDPKADEGAILAKQKEVNSLQQTLRDDMVQLRLEQRRILTPEQLKKLADLQAGFGWGKGRRFG